MALSALSRAAMMTKTATGTLRRTSARSHCKTVSLHIKDQLFAKGCCCMIVIPQGFFPLSARFSSMPVSTTKRRCVYFPSTISRSAFVGWEEISRIESLFVSCDRANY